MLSAVIGSMYTSYNMNLIRLFRSLCYTGCIRRISPETQHQKYRGECCRILWKMCKGPEHDISCTAFAQSASEYISSLSSPLDLLSRCGGDYKAITDFHGCLIIVTQIPQLNLVASWALIARALLVNKQFQPQRDITDIAVSLTKFLPNTMPLIHLRSRKYEYIEPVGYIIGLLTSHALFAVVNSCFLTKQCDCTCR
jgi:hypothetical protein